MVAIHGSVVNTQTANDLSACRTQSASLLAIYLSRKVQSSNAVAIAVSVPAQFLHAAEVPMRSLSFLAMALVVAIAGGPQASPDEAAVRNIIQEEISAWNSGDAAAYSRHFAADGTFTNIRGEFFTGRQPFIEKHDNLFRGPFHGSTLKQDVVSLKFVRPDVAVAEVLTSVSGIPKLFPGTNTDDKGRLRTRLLQVLVKDGGEWKIAAYHNTDVKLGVAVPDPQ